MEVFGEGCSEASLDDDWCVRYIQMCLSIYIHTYKVNPNSLLVVPGQIIWLQKNRLAQREKSAGEPRSGNRAQRLCKNQIVAVLIKQ